MMPQEQNRVAHLTSRSRAHDLIVELTRQPRATAAGSTLYGFCG
jgi:hypothetical protein